MTPQTQTSSPCCLGLNFLLWSGCGICFFPLNFMVSSVFFKSLSTFLSENWGEAYVDWMDFQVCLEVEGSTKSLLRTLWKVLFSSFLWGEKAAFIKVRKAVNMNVMMKYSKGSNTVVEFTMGTDEMESLRLHLRPEELCQWHPQHVGCITCQRILIPYAYLKNLTSPHCDVHCADKGCNKVSPMPCGGYDTFRCILCFIL